MQRKMKWADQFNRSSHIGILVVDKDRNNLFVNKHLCDMFGYSESEILKTTGEIFHVNHETFLHFAQLAFDAVLAGKPLGIDYQFKKADGTLFWMHIAGDPIQDSHEVLWTMVDITPRVEALKKIDDLNERKDLALLGNNDGVWDWNLETNEVYLSPRWKEIIGYRYDELPDDFAEWESRAHPDDVAKVYEDIENHIQGKTPYVDNVHRMKHKDGHYV